MASECGTTTASTGSDSCSPNCSSRISSSSESLQSGNEDLATFCSKFRAPKCSELTRKRAVRRSALLTAKKSKPSCSTDPKSVTPIQRVREFPKEELSQSAGKLFCNACREEVSLKLSIVKLHVASGKHLAGKEALARREARE